MAWWYRQYAKADAILAQLEAGESDETWAVEQFACCGAVGVAPSHVRTYHIIVRIGATQGGCSTDAALPGLGLNLVHPQCTSQYKINRAMASGTTKTSA